MAIPGRRAQRTPPRATIGMVGGDSIGRWRHKDLYFGPLHLSARQCFIGWSDNHFNNNLHLTSSLETTNNY